MENLLYLNAVLPYIYLFSLWNFRTEGSMQIYSICGTGILIQIIATTIISILSRNKSKLANVNFIVKLLQIPYYILYFVLATGIFSVLMALAGVGIFFLPILIAVDALIFSTTVIPAEICAIKLKMNNRITAGRMLFYLIFNTWYIVDLITAFKMRNDYRNLGAFVASNPNLIAHVRM
ncbi:hypothetical protein [Butyrivibrio sp. WCE2006]|uniref:hypothetical protein n=1 Tax=Butyrivibrio sp. WCE2006 TaxID=1410611 RepID=UPI0005D1420E|nr:hypothetical protein [Butyrivibrio sp. WCE2006]